MMIAALACTLGLLQQPIPADFAKRADTYMTGWAQAHRFSGAVLVAANGKVIFRKAYGYANWEKHTPMTLNQPCVIFSVSKQFTAAAVLLLQDRGRLNLNDPIRKYLSELPKEWEAVTIHHLLTHTSGIDPVNVLTFAKRKPTDPNPLKYTPGTHYEYSNFGYVLLGKLVSRVAQEPFSQFLQENVFTPLHMTHSGEGGYSPQHKEIARGHDFLGGKITVVEQDLKVIEGAGSVHSTVDDMLKWSQALDKPGFLSGPSLKAMFTAWTDVGMQQWYGYGWFTDVAGRAWVHTGGGAGFNSVIDRVTKDDVRIVMLSNFGSRNGELPYQYLWAIVQGSGPETPHVPLLETAARYCGAYRQPNGKVIKVSLEEGELRLALPKAKPFTIYLKSGNSFTSEGGTFEFRPNPRGIFDLRMTTQDHTVLSKHLVPNPSQLAAWVGTYTAPGAPPAEVKARAGELFVHSPEPADSVITSGPIELQLFYLGGNRFAIPGVPAELVFSRKPDGTRVATSMMDGKVAMVMESKPHAKRRSR